MGIMGKGMRRLVTVGVAFGSLAWLAGALTTTHPSAQQAPADLVLHNGKVLTVDARDSMAQAVAIAGGRIVAVGSND